MITKEQVEQFNNLELEKAELDIELRRVNGFLTRPSDNKDTLSATRDNKIMVKFAGTACWLPVGIFNAELMKRKREIEDRLAEIQITMDNI